jgi:signal transduction histidine kinase
MGPTARVTARALTWPLLPALFVASVVCIDRRPDDAGAFISAGDIPFVAAMLACWVVGVVLTGRAFEQPAGWAFLGLGTSLAYSSLADTYTELAITWRPEMPAGQLAATLSDTSYVWWFVFLALVLQFTQPPDPSRTQRWLPIVTVAGGVTYQIAALLRPTRLDPPYDELSSPLAVDGLSAVVEPLAAAAITALGICLVASAVRLVNAWRHAEGEARRQLLWLVAGTLPLAPCVVASFAASYAGHADIAGYVMAAATVSIAVGAGLSVLRYRLYDVERVVTDSAAYAIASAAVVVIFVVVVVVISETTPIDPGSQLPTVLATLAGAGAARVAYVWGRRAVAKRVNRERFDAVETVRAGLRDASADLDVVLATALGDPAARVLYPMTGGAWATSDGRDVRPGPDAVEVRRHGVVTAKVEFDPQRSQPPMVEAVAREAAAEIDNVALRAELRRQVEVVTESRERLASAQLEERRRIERDLHDGAQQRLLAIALQLQSAQVNGQENVLRDEVERAVASLGLTVQELRDLAGGLQPAALSGGGLLAAVVDLVSRIPLAIEYDVVDRRFPADVEGAAWFVIAEAVANAVKHAGADEISIQVTSDGTCVRVVVADCGVGDADPTGHGLQGLADRVAALRGTLRVSDNQPRGTVVEAGLPCGS